MSRTLIVPALLALAGAAHGQCFWSHSSATGPAARATSGLAYDPVHANSILFGGYSNAGTFLAES
jgi:hypothetical protein